MVLKHYSVNCLSVCLARYVTLCSLSDTSNATMEDLQQSVLAHLIAPTVFFRVCSAPRTAVIAFLSQTPTHRWCDTVSLMRRLCLCTRRCVFEVPGTYYNRWAKPTHDSTNQGLQLCLDARQDQLHKTTASRTGRRSQPCLHLLWTSKSTCQVISR